jgi:hypothetical protein
MAANEFANPGKLIFGKLANSTGGDVEPVKRCEKQVARCHYPRESLRRAQINKLENHAAEALSLTEVM